MVALSHIPVITAAAIDPVSRAVTLLAVGLEAA